MPTPSSPSEPAAPPVVGRLLSLNVGRPRSSGRWKRADPACSGTGQLPNQPSGTPGQGPVVTFSRSNLAVAWDPSYSSLLEFAEACDVPVSFSCRTGVCHSCESGIVDGAVNYATQPLEPLETGRVLVCCSEPAGEVTLEL
jgi:ferredoxin